jgi:hypothetical protein
MLKIHGWKVLTGSGYGPVAGSCEHGNEHTGSIKDGEILIAERLLASRQRLCSMELELYYNLHYIRFDSEPKIGRVAC